MSENPLQARALAPPGCCSLSVAPRQAEVLGTPGGGCSGGAGGGGPRFPARPPRVSGLGMCFRPLPGARLLAGSSRAFPGLRGLDFRGYINKTQVPSGYKSVPERPRMKGDCTVRVGLWVAGRQTFTKVLLGRGTTFRASGS